MTTGQWQAALRIFYAALELPVDEQRAFVESQCADPEILERIFEEMDAHHNAEEIKAPDPDVHACRTGTNAGRYQVGELLGRGGMGEVYAARDTTLNRPVALKFLLPRFLADSAARKRFVREAKAASALNHPNLVTIHEMIDAGPGMAIAMERVNGKALNELRGSAVPFALVVQIGSQVAAALAAAHQQGIVHRDLKPENLMVRPDGFVKVLDFGLARRFGVDVLPLQGSASGALTGTLRYMSPEQLRGEPLSGASDVFSLGVVLYELAAGVHPFDAGYAWETALAIQTRDVASPSTVSGDTPSWAGDLILAMLNRDPTLRPNAHVVAARLSSAPEPVRPQRKYKKWVGLAALAAVTAVAAWSMRDRFTDSQLKAVEFTQYPGDEDMASFSPDGQSVAFVWNGPTRKDLDIYVRAVASTSLQRLTADPLDDFSPAWSPNGKSIAFLRKAPNEKTAALLVVPPEGGSERKIADVHLDMFETVASLAWTPDGKFLLTPDYIDDQRVGLFLVSAVDGTRIRLTVPPPGGHDIGPAIAPNGRAVAFMRSVSEGFHSLFVLPLNSAYLADGSPKEVPAFPNLRVSPPQWTPDGKNLLFAANPTSEMSMWRVRVPTGAETPPLPKRETFARPSSRIRISPPSTATRRLMYSSEIRERNLWRVPLRAGNGPRQRLGTPEEANTEARVSPDGSRMVLESMRTGSSEIWVANIDGSQPRQLTNFGGPVTSSPAWSPDGRRIAFDSRVEGRPNVYVIPAGGGHAERFTTESTESYFPTWSQDGRWIYFCSPRSGLVEVWRQPTTGGSPEQMTHGGGWIPAESPDGASLYYQKRLPAGWSLRRLDLKSGDDTEILTTIVERAFDIAKDGIYYVPEAAADGRFTLQFLDLKTGRSRLVCPLQRPVTVRLGLSPDGSFLLYSQLDSWGQDLMLVENFH